MLGSVRVYAKSEGFIKYVIPWQLSNEWESDVWLFWGLAYQDFGLCI